MPQLRAIPKLIHCGDKYSTTVVDVIGMNLKTVNDIAAKMQLTFFCMILETLLTKIISIPSC